VWKNKKIGEYHRKPAQFGMRLVFMPLHKNKMENIYQLKKNCYNLRYVWFL